MSGAPSEYASRRPVVTFVVLAYAWSWLAWLPAVTGAPDPTVTLSYVVGGFGPLVAGGVTTWLASDSVRSWAAPIVRWRVAPRWYGVAFALPLLVVALASGFLALTGYDLALESLPGRAGLWGASFAFVALVGGGNEEPGWRGFALYRLQAASTPVRATLSLGVVWALWHVPQLLSDPTVAYGLPWLLDTWPSILLRVLNIVGFAFPLTWLYNATDRSVLLVVLLHAGVNTANSTLVPLPLEATAGSAYEAVLLTVTAAVWVVALALVAATGGRLGHSPG